MALLSCIALFAGLNRDDIFSRNDNCWTKLQSQVDNPVRGERLEYVTSLRKLHQQFQEALGTGR